MRRVLIAVAGLVGLLALLAGGLCAYLATADLRPLAERLAAQVTGRPVGIGSLQVDWGMRTRVALRDLKLGNAPWSGTPHMIALGGLSAEVDLGSLLRGRLRYERLVLEKLTMVLERGPGHVGNWKMGAGGSAGDGLVPRNRTQVPTVIDLVLDDGLLIYRDAEIGLELRIEARRIDMTTADDDAPVRLAWRGAYNGIAATLEAEGQSFAVLRRREVPYPTTARLTAGENRLSFSGTLMEPLDFEGVAGAATAEIPDLAAFLAILDAGLDLPVAARIEGRFERKGDDWRLEDAKGEVAKNVFTGTLALDEAPRHQPDELRLALRFVRLDLDPLLAQAGPKQAFRQIPLDPGRAEKINVSANIQAAEVTGAGFAGADLRVEGRRDAGGLAIENFRVQAFGGTLAGNGSARRVDRGTKVTLSGGVDRLKMEEIARRFGTDTAGLSGRLAGQFALEAEGRTVGEAASTLRGHNVTTLSEGRVPRALMEKVSTDLRFLFRDRTNWSEIICFLTLLEIRDGIGQFAPLRLRTAETTLTGRGRIDFGRERVDVAITTEQRAARSLFSLNIPLQARGSFGQVAVAPLVGPIPPARLADLASLPAASRALAEGSPCLR